MSEPRYYRCKDSKCHRKWHIESLKYESGKSARPKSNLFDTPKEPSESGCPSCGGSLEPEAGTFEEMYQEGEMNE